MKYKTMMTFICALLFWSGLRPLNAQSSAFNVLYNFTLSLSVYDPLTNSDGINPTGGLNLSASTLFGTANMGGSVGVGTLFRVNTDASDFTLLHTFTGDSNDGEHPTGSILSCNTLYGTTTGGGNESHGTVFRMNTDGSGFTNLHNFSATTNSLYLANADGVSPVGGLIISGNTLYGTTKYGGTWGEGTVFRVNTDGSDFTNLYNFYALYNVATNGDGAEPQAGLILSGNTLYGTTSGWGAEGGGTVFRLNTDGSDFTNLHSFPGASGEQSGGSYASVVISGNTLYGTYQADAGSVFRVNTDGSNFTNLYTFAGGDDGDIPGKLALSGNALYGTTALGGSGGWGTVFQINTNGSAFTILYNFPAVPDYPENYTNSGGADPSSLILSGNVLYGTAAGGGSGGDGTVFALALPAPPLGITPAGDQVAITWPAAAANYQLQTAADLSSGNWRNITNELITDGASYFFTTSVTNKAAYFRLTQK